MKKETGKKPAVGGILLGAGVCFALAALLLVKSMAVVTEGSLLLCMGFAVAVAAVGVGLFGLFLEKVWPKPPSAN